MMYRRWSTKQLEELSKEMERMAGEKKDYGKRQPGEKQASEIYKTPKTFPIREVLSEMA